MTKEPTWKTKFERLSQDFISIYWMARRYADMRSTYAPSSYNDAARNAVSLGVKLPEMEEGMLARDGMGRVYDKLTHEEAKKAHDWDRVATNMWVEDKIALLERINEMGYNIYLKQRSSGESSIADPHEEAIDIVLKELKTQVGK